MPLDFQNLALAWIITGKNYILDGHGSGGIFGNGQTWYSWAKEEGNKVSQKGESLMGIMTDPAVRPTYEFRHRQLYQCYCPE